MSDLAIRAEGLSKQYRVGGYAEPYFTLRDTLAQLGHSVVARLTGRAGGRPDPGFFWALQDVSFQVRHSEVLGIIGRNGAGKTTLLKVLSRVTEPTAGRAEIRGLVASLLEVGTGFHPELSGRENIFLSGAILGMRRSEIVRKFDEILAFAEVERFVDTPVKRYSSGMHLRLAFAVAAHLEVEIMLVDEVLAVGDAGFQRKCLGKMSEVARAGRTVLFVSHNMAAIQRLCTRAIWLDYGRVAHDGLVQEVVTAYLGAERGRMGAQRQWAEPGGGPGDGVVRLRGVRSKNARGEVCEEFTVRDPIDIEIEFDVQREGEFLESDFYLNNEQGQVVFVSKAEHGNHWRHRPRERGRYREICRIPGDLLNEGRYSIHVGVTTPPWTVHAGDQDVIAFTVTDEYAGGARGSYPREWPPSIVRPLLHWRCEYVPPEGSATSAKSVAPDLPADSNR